MNFANITDVLQWIVSVASLIGIIYLRYRKLPGEVKQTNGDASDKFASAATKTAALNEKYLKMITDLQTRLEAVEKIKRYQIVVEFETSIPPQVGKVEVVPLEP